jgi:acetyl esterase/lipase
VLQGANDTNVPKAESDLVVEALRQSGRLVEYVVYEDEGHGFTRRETRLDAMARTVEFFVRHLEYPRGGRLRMSVGKASLPLSMWALLWAPPLVPPRR